MIRTITLLACLLAAPAAMAQLEPQQVLRLEREANTRCRGGSGDQPDTQQACGARDAYDKVLGMLGWCYGRQGEPGAQRQWHACTATSIRPN